MAQAVGSSHTQVIFIPPLTFSTFIVQRGTITMFGIVGTVPPIGIPVPIPIAGMPIAVRSIIIAVAIDFLLKGTVRNTGGPMPTVRPLRAERTGENNDSGLPSGCRASRIPECAGQLSSV
jgi:hypothetical protein